MQTPLKPISPQERIWAEQLPAKRSRQYQLSRGCLRDALSQLSGTPPLEIPINAAPGQAPVLAKGYGYISLSHCCDALLIGWSPLQLGIDLEREDRALSTVALVNRYFNKEEKQQLKSLKGEELRCEVLHQWLIKEASIKWQRGNIAADLKQWRYQKDSQSSVHKMLGEKLHIMLINYDKWSMAVASNEVLTNKDSIICISC